MLRSVTLGSLLVASAVADPCECLNWKEVYETKRVACGEGQELMAEKMGYRMAYWAPSVFPKATEVCHNFQVMNNNMCFNWDNPSVYGTDTVDKQWCYVDSKCTKLNGGRKVPDSETIIEWIPKKLLQLMGLNYGVKFYDFVMTNFHTPQPLKRDVSVKVCSGSDKLTRNLDPDTFLDIGKASGAHLEFFTKHAYVVVRNPKNHSNVHPIWMDVRDHIGKGGDLKQLPKVVTEAMEKNVPIIIDADAFGHHDKSQRIIKGSKVYKLNAKCPNNNCKGHKPGSFTYSTPKGHDIGEL